MSLPRILIVDDEPRNLSLLEALLVGMNVDLTRASGGREAIELFARAVQGHVTFDVVLLDVMMPEVDGLTALAEMRKVTPASEHVPIILVTALSAREDRLRGLEAGADDFLTKPLDPGEVRCRVRNFLALRRAQIELRARAEELMQLQKAKADLTRMIVHDLKNPLAGVGSNLGWIEKKLRKIGHGDDELSEAIADARSGADRLLSLISGLIEIEKAESGQLVVRKVKVGIRQLLEGIARRHGREAQAKQIEIVVEAPLDTDVELDPDIISRVVENLIENATRYTEVGGKIGLLLVRDGRNLELVVANTGSPIPEDRRARLFDKHQTGEDKGARGRNLGLGLYFCKLASKAHGGDISVSSREGWPTCFVVKLPSEPPQEQPREEPRVARPARGAFLD